MSEIKTEIKQNPDGSYTITDAHSTADIVRWLLTQDSKETILYLLGNASQRTWVGLTDAEANELWESTDSDWELMKRTEAKLKAKNGFHSTEKNT